MSLTPLKPIPAEQVPPVPWWLRFKVDIPPMEFGTWRVVEAGNLKCYFPPLPPRANEIAHGRPMPGVWPGRYTALQRLDYREETGSDGEGGKAKYGRFEWETWMSDSPNEIWEQIRAIRRLKGRVLIGGLGLGVMVKAALER